MAGLYIHIPFCHSKCAYCDFYSKPRRDFFEAVVEGIAEEFNARADEVDGGFSTIYFGGGTPSILEEKHFLTVFNAIGEENVRKAEEITIEANPEDVCRDKALRWKHFGINRISIGVQALDDKVLRSMGRRHTSAQALNAIGILQDAGFDNISADLIYGMPGVDSAKWASQLREVFSTGITHLSAYCLTYHEGTPLYRLWQKGRVVPSTDEEIEQQFGILQKEADIAGFEHYEISNLAKPGFRSKHNSSYWNPRSQWLGLGPSAHSFDGTARRIDIPDISQWLKRLPLPFDIEEETEQDLVNDNIVTALRTIDGLDLNTIPDKYRLQLLQSAERFIEDGDMRFDESNQRLRINPARWLISDLFIREMLI